MSAGREGSLRPMEALIATRFLIVFHPPPRLGEQRLAPTQYRPALDTIERD